MTESVRPDEREKFIYGRIDVEILDHEKTFEAGEGAFGVYVAAILYCRKKLNDGFMSKAAAQALLGGAGARHYDKLVSIGWLIEHADGRVEVWNYAKKNDTRAQVDAAREAAKLRMRAKREANKAAEKPLRKRSRERAPNISRTTSVSASDVPSSSSLSEDLDLDPEGDEGEDIPSEPPPAPSEPSPPHESVARVRLRPDLTPSAENPYPMPEDFPLTGEARGAAELAGVRDIDDEWVKFRARQIRDGTCSTTRGWYAGAWTKWFIDARTFQSEKRSRDAKKQQLADADVVRPYHAEAKLPKRERPLTTEEKAAVAASVANIFAPKAVSS